jgi:hypothetical protein
VQASGPGAVVEAEAGALNDIQDLRFQMADVGFENSEARGWVEGMSGSMRSSAGAIFMS